MMTSLVIVGGLSATLTALLAHGITSATSVTVHPRAFQRRAPLTHVRVDERLYMRQIEEWMQEPRRDLLDGTLLRWKRLQDQPRLDTDHRAVV
jgi:hypothetical protein